MAYTYLTTTEVARLAGVTTETVCRAVKAGKMVAERDEADVMPFRHRRGSPRKMIWKIDPASGRRWAAEARDRQQESW